MTISLIACMDKNRSIGNNNKLLTHIPNDLKRFKELTLGKICVQGRKTYESIIDLNGKPLSNRTNVVLTKNKNYQVEKGVFVYNDVEQVIQEVMEYSDSRREIMIIGGQEIYELFLPYADKIYLTIIKHKFDQTDSFFPELTIEDWKIVSYQSIHDDKTSSYPYSFIEYVKRSKK